MIDKLEPIAVFSFFEKICTIPHGSYNTGLIADYIVDFAKDHGLEYKRDLSNNLVIKKPATFDCKSDSTIIIQGHLDMVCAKDDAYQIDFENDGLTLECDEEYISAKGTTLGGDDGIAVAIALAILDSNDITHPSLDCVSYGPNLIDIHTPNERMEIESVKRVYEFTKRLLKKL